MFEEFFNQYHELEPPDIITPDYIDVKTSLDNTLTFPISTKIETTTLWDREYGSLLEAPTTIDLYTSESSIDITDNIISYARLQLGKPYIYGSTNSSKGFDCSSLILNSYKSAGITIPRDTKGMLEQGTKVDLQDAKVGDVLILKSPRSPSGRHAKMISKIENGKTYVILASGTRRGVIEEELTNTNGLIGVRRFSKNPSIPQDKKSVAKQVALALRLALINKGVPNTNDWVSILTAQAMHESGWGKGFGARNGYNFSNMKAGKGLAYISSNTSEHGPSGWYPTVAKWRKFNSTQDWANEFVAYLDRKFQAFNGSPSTYYLRIQSGRTKYATDPNYVSKLNKLHNSIDQYIGRA